MSFFVAAAWSILSVYALMLMLALLASAHTPPHIDLVTGFLCQAVAYLATLIFFTLIHEKERPLSEVFGLRRTSVSLCLIAVALGLALQGPLTLITDAILRHFPLPPGDAAEYADQFNVPLLHQKIATVLCAGLLGPFIEELFFRGALYRGLRRQHAFGLTLVGVSLLFAASHHEPRLFLPVFLAGMAIGWVRGLAGSLWPGVLLHASYNTVAVVFNVRHGIDADMLTHSQNLAAAFASAGLLVLYRAVAMRSETSAQARAEDAV
jgi:membrane protease YdiL (CAAX protease family)